MMRRNHVHRAHRARSLAAPFVATMTLAACTKNGDGAKIVGDPGTPTDTATTTVADAAPAPALTNDGYGGCYAMVDGEKKYAPKCPEALLAPPPTGELTYKRGDECNRVPDGIAVQCPSGGPTGILPDPDSVSIPGGSISLQYGTLHCLKGQFMKCPPGVMCNPPPPETIPCPPELLPKLSPGVPPTKRDGLHCWYGSVEVACPATVAAAPGDCPAKEPANGEVCTKPDVACGYKLNPKEGPSADLCVCVHNPPNAKPPLSTMSEWKCAADMSKPVIKN
jgi:hypothetical protein